jgi:Zn-dependent M28 family amino/carboxypeptidase
LVERARKHSKTGIRHLVTKGGEDLFRRSDQFSFHQIGLPVLFFFEGLPISRNVDYHTWRDGIEGVSVRKITRSARLVRNAVWLLASDEGRPPAPGR